MLYRYFSIALALAMTLGGLQLPGYLDQYNHRANAHLIEVQKNLSGFQEIADRHHDGSLEALIARHRASSDTVFREEADAISAMVTRRVLFQTEIKAMQGTLMDRVIHLALRADPELRAETTLHYTWTITLNESALVCGGIALVVGVALSDLLRLLLILLFRRNASETRSVH